MAKNPQTAMDFQYLVNNLKQETDSFSNKLQILYTSKGYFDATQASKIILAFSAPNCKLKAIHILEPRLCRMSCQEARAILTAFNLYNDRLVALNYVKRVLTDCQTTVGEEYILSTFPYESDKWRALDVLKTVRSDIKNIVGAGGHHGYAALGCVQTQSLPLNPHMYGSWSEQIMRTPGHGRIGVVPGAQPTAPPSSQTAHPSYSYPGVESYAVKCSYPGTVGYPARVEGTSPYPGGAPPLDKHSGAPAPTGFPQLDSQGFVY